ncbi:Protein Shroom2 [Orchesella cincta]|uniref:Protein Shroom2 n=1 Tax=Orchesella cincta TaxID=48709 RepID=A0A1D2NMS9_ORCCI|nr:Protein Shroom2 [Orchesella cincta]
MHGCNGHAPLPADSAYFTTSESKAKFLTQYNSDIKKEPISRTDGEELDKQKEELVSRISRKLEILRTEQLVLREEIQSNEQLGQMVVERVKQTAKRNEFDKFKLHVEEIEKITSLLLGISGRLARAENALMGLSDPPNPQEKKILESKRDKLREQLDEAKILKENIDRRSAQVSSFLQKYLTVEEYADYDHFVKMKAKLIIDAREIDDKIKLGEEQLGALKDALNTTLPLSPNSSSS